MQEAEFQQRFQAAFRFGKLEKREASYAGRRIRQRDQYVLVDQEKYILEKLQPVFLREKQQKDRKLSLDEFSQLRSLVYKISWVATESRPEASGSASILAQHMKAPTVSDVLIANRVVKFLRSSASQCLTIWRHDPRSLRVISVSDAGGIGRMLIRSWSRMMEFDKEFTPKHQRLCGVPLGVSVLSTQRLREKRSRCLRRSQMQSGHKS